MEHEPSMNLVRKKIVLEWNAYGVDVVAIATQRSVNN